VTQLRRSARGAPELAKNLAIVLEHLNDPKNALEADPRAAKATGRPAPTGYTGLESFLQYVYDQTLSTNVYDQTTHLLKVGLIFGTDCADYADAPRARAVAEECAAGLGPSGPGSPRPTPPTRTPARRGAARGKPIDSERGPGLPPAPRRPRRPGRRGRR
jgi:hypothetical protein